MESVFFDTSAFNHINSDQIRTIQRLLKTNNVEILTTPQIFAELAGTFEEDPARGRELVKTYRELISSKIIKPIPILLMEELEYFKGEERKSIYLDKGQTKKFIKYLKIPKRGSLDEKTKSFTEGMQDRKKENKNFFKKEKQKLDPLWEGPEKQFENFESFYNAAREQGCIHNELVEYLKRVIDPRQIDMVDEIAGEIEPHLGKLQYIQTAVKLSSAISYRYHLQKEGAKWGDLEDISIMIAATTCDAYVSDDVGAREMAKLLFPGKKILSLEEFLKELS